MPNRYPSAAVRQLDVNLVASVPVNPKAVAAREHCELASDSQFLRRATRSRASSLCWSAFWRQVGENSGRIDDLSPTRIDRQDDSLSPFDLAQSRTTRFSQSLIKDRSSGIDFLGR
jgi:hypothetical protein